METLLIGVNLGVGVSSDAAASGRSVSFEGSVGGVTGRELDVLAISDSPLRASTMDWHFSEP